MIKPVLHRYNEYPVNACLLMVKLLKRLANIKDGGVWDPQEWREDEIKAFELMLNVETMRLLTHERVTGSIGDQRTLAASKIVVAFIANMQYRHVKGSLSTHLHGLHWCGLTVMVTQSPTTNNAMIINTDQKQTMYSISGHDKLMFCYELINSLIDSIREMEGPR